MIGAGPPGFPRLLALLTVFFLVFVGLLIAPVIDPGTGSTAARFVSSYSQDASPTGTPAVVESDAEEQRRSDPLDADPVRRDEPEGDPLDGDPLDGDPLDGPPPLIDIGAPPARERLVITRSGRPGDQPSTLATYDDDPTTLWVPAASDDEPWLWLDLGGERRLHGVRWLARGSGAVRVAVSTDRQRWRSVEEIPVRDGWDGIELADDARYVRLLLAANEDGELPALAEVAVYGSDRGGGAKDKPDRPRKRAKQRRDNGGNALTVAESAQDAGETSGRKRGKSRVEISTEPGETECTGKKARCRARAGRVSVEEDCAGNGTCIIDVRADGGSATCNASGGDAPRARDLPRNRGNDRNRRDRNRDRNERNQNERGSAKQRGSDGGRCEAVANGGTVTIGDINP